MEIQKKADSLAQSMLQPINTTGILILNVFTILWGIWVANPFFTVFTQAAVYSQLMAVFGAPSEIVWGCIAIVCGAIALYGVLKPSRRTLLIGAGTQCIHWLVISSMFFLGDWHNTAGITALCLAVYAAFVYLNIKVNYFG